MASKTVNTQKQLKWFVAPILSHKGIIKELARVGHWEEPQVIWKGGMIDTPVIEGKWRYERLLDYSTQPSGAVKRIDLILKYIPSDRLGIAHEIETETETKPKVKPLPWIVAPEPETKPRVKPLPWVVAPEPEINPLRRIDWEKVGKISWSVAKVIGIVLLGALAILAACMGVAVGCMTDPQICIITEEGEWVSFYTYY